MTASQPLVFCTASYEYLGASLAGLVAAETGTVVRRHFPDGERYQRVETPCADRDVILVGGTVTDADTLELYDLACGLVTDGASRLTLVIPFFGYSTMERDSWP